MTAFCHLSFSSTSAADTLNLFWSRVMRLLTICLFPFRDPTAGIKISIVQTPTTTPSPTSQLSGYSFESKGFDDIADLDVVEPLQPDAALIARKDFLDVFFESAQRPDFALVHDHVIPHETSLGPSGD